MKGVPECIVPGQGGLLELSEDLLQRLICTEPIEKYYDVEDEPFARGKYAAVRRCRERHSGRQFAAKFLRKRSRSDGDHRIEILHEVAVLEACKPCSRVVNLHQVFESSNEMVLMLEMACGGELQMLLDSDEVPAEGQVQQFMRQIMEGICFLHDINVAHLDLKPQNLVLTGTFPECEVKLCDFGISRYLSQGADVREILGTPDYVAPEVLNYEPISLATDMWSVGVLLYVLLTGCSPFGGDTKQETFCNISQCRLDFPEDLFEEISADAKDLMTKLMVKSPSARLTAKQCIEHAWFAKHFESSPSPTNVSTIPTTPVSTTSEPTSSTPTKTNNNNNNSDTPVEPAPRLSLKFSPIAESTASKTNTNERRTPLNNNIPEIPARPSLVKGLSETRRQSLRHNLDSLIKRLDDTIEEPKKHLSRVDSLNRRNRAAAMQTMPPIRYSRSADSINNINEASIVFRFQKVVVIDEDEGLPPSPISTDNSSISDSNSDTISEMSIDSSSDRSSIISLDDSLDYPYKFRHYSSCHNIWEAARHQQRPSPRPWPPKECNDSFVKAMSRFRASPKLTVYSGPPSERTPRRSIGLDIVHRNANLVVIREHKAVNNRYAKTSELKCESVRSKIRKFQVPQSAELNNLF